ncbi:MAG TPA: SufS family cysteine desulfurase [Vitreimonas sp.]|nr:SufS family cysteine desulfurase [Vitreimonas sp.]
MIDANTIKTDFPILSRKVNDKPLVYLDNAATSQKPRAVIQAIVDYYEHHNANVHRGVHQLGDESTRAFHDSRQEIAQFMGAEAEELVVVRNTTEALNQICYTWGEYHVGADDVLIVTEMEHHSNIVPWQELAKRKNALVKFVTVDDQGRVELDSLQALLSEYKTRIKVVAFIHVSNTLGTLNPLEKIVATIDDHFGQAQRPLLVVDGAQAAAHLPVNFAKLKVDCYVVSAHKMLGPMGIGGLLIRKSLLKTWPPFLFGGGMINEVSTQGTTFAEDLEERFTAGTPDVASLAGWAAACEYLAGVGMRESQTHDRQLVEYTLQQLQTFSQVKIIGPTDFNDHEFDRVGSVAFVYEGVHAHDVGQVLDSEGVAVRSGHHCTMPLHVKFGWPASTRVSFQIYNSIDDVDSFITALQKVKTIFGK